MSMGFNTTIPHGLPTFGRTSTAKWLFILSLLASPTFAPSAFAADSEAGTAAQARQSVIKGVVVDQNGEPVPGAAVVVDGTTTGTVTDFDGNFSISVAAGTQLNFSFIGYTSVSAPAADGMKVVLEDDSQQIEEIAVVAYGAQKKVTVTGAISSVKSEDLIRTPVSSVNNVLAGQLSGVTTVQYSGEPGSDAADIFVRGKASFAGSDAVKPLIQVDGVEREMYDIDPNEIESVTVLKDASATAVFGVRGANGVILVTTKRGKEGKANINASTAFSALTPTKMVEMANSYEYANFYNKMRENDGLSPVFSPEVIEKFRTGEDPIHFPSHDWADYVMKKFTLQTQHNLSIDGGNDKVKYFVSVGAFTQGGLFDMFDVCYAEQYPFDYRYKRFNYRSNIDIEVTKYTTLSVNVSGKLDRTNKPITGQGSAGMIKNIYFSTPFSSAGFVNGMLVYNTTNTSDNMQYDSKGEPTGAFTLPFIGGSPFAYLTGGNYRQDNTKLQMDLVFNQKLDMLTKGLSFKMKGSYNSSYFVQKEANGGTILTGNPVNKPDGSISYRQTAENRLPTGFKNSVGKGRDWYFETSLNYDHTFAESHTVRALALYNQSKIYYLKEYADIPRTYVGLVARVAYDWKNRYMAEFNFGYNGSENFAPGKRFGKFPAGSVGWAVSEEGFFDNLKPMLSFLKLRASWGLVGNDQVGGSRFMYTADPFDVNNNAVRDHYGTMYLYGTSETYEAFPYGINGAGERQKNNANVTWEKAFKQDYGIDINFLDNKLSTTFDYYYEKRTDILAVDNTAPSILGYAKYPYSNFGKVDSWGWEASIGWNQRVNDDLRWWAKLNISHNQNEIIEDRQAPQENEFQYTKGRRIGSRSQYKFWGYYDATAEERYKKEFGVSQLPTQTLAKTMKPGDAIFVDLDGNGVVDANDASRDYGYTDDPEYIAGLNLGAAWKNLTVSMQWTGAWNVSRMIESVFRQPFVTAAGQDEGGLLKYHLDNTWSEENPSQSAEYPRASWENATQNYAGCTLYEKDSKYLRLKTAEIAYNFDFEFMKTIGLRRLQLALNGYNLLTFTPYLWGDPETRASASPSYPLQRTYTASLKMTF